MQQTLMHLPNSKSSTVNLHLIIVLRSHPVSQFLENPNKCWFDYSRITFLVYSTWGLYSECSKTCGDGEKTRSRTCISGICSLATSSDLIQTDICNKGDCKLYKKNHLWQPQWYFKKVNLHRGVTGQTVTGQTVTGQTMAGQPDAKWQDRDRV